MTDLEKRLAILEYEFHEQCTVNHILINLLLHHDNNFKPKAAEALRLVLQKQVEQFPLSEFVEKQLRAIRDELIAEPNQQLVDLFLKPSVHLVDKE